MNEESRAFKDRLSPRLHKGEKGDPGVTPAVATKTEAEAGTENTKLMTPLRVKEAITKNLAGYVPTSDVANAANKIPKYNTSGHLVLPNGAEFWIG